MHSVETVSILRERSPDDEWFFITGADEVSNLLAWREPDRLLEQIVMVAATRPGYDLSKLDHLEAALRNFDRIFPDRVYAGRHLGHRDKAQDVAGQEYQVSRTRRGA